MDMTGDVFKPFKPALTHDLHAEIEPNLDPNHALQLGNLTRKLVDVK